MRVIFMGTPDFAVPTLDALVDAGHDVVGVVARPDKPQGRGRKVQSPPTIARARELGLTVKQPRAIKRGPFPEWVESVKADVAVVIAYGRILTPRLLQAPARGCINVHASLLPKYRGAAPIHWAVINGESKTGITTMQMDAGLDTGDMLLTSETTIGPNETVGVLWDRLKAMGATLLTQTLEQLDTITPITQDHDAASHAPMLEKAHGKIDWTKPAEVVHNHIRGVNPWPGAFTTFRGQNFKVWRATPAQGSGAPGTVLEAKKRLIVACGDGAVLFESVQRAGKRAQPGPVFVQGTRLQPGERLGDTD
jgi:methionyl-tRNA formyltransferase